MIDNCCTVAAARSSPRARHPPLRAANSSGGGGRRRPVTNAGVCPRQSSAKRRCSRICLISEATAPICNPELKTFLALFLTSANHRRGLGVKLHCRAQTFSLVASAARCADGAGPHARTPRSSLYSPASLALTRSPIPSPVLRQARY